MTFLPFFESGDDLPSLAAKLAPRLRELAEQGVYLGTSSWKYEGWLGSIYSPEKYITKGKFSTKRFQTECLEEYAATFPVVGGDFSFYLFPSSDYWQRLFDQTPKTLAFGLKVPEEITVHTWPGHSRYGQRAGMINNAFLDPILFTDAFCRRLEPYRDRVAVLMFEFGTLSKNAFAKPETFFERLHEFVGALPPGFRYAVEIRNPEYLGMEYFGMLASHNVAHIFNAWTRMPELGVQIAMPGAFTADFSVVRALLKKDRPYEQAVKMFTPYKELQEPNESLRTALRSLIDRAIGLRQRAYVFVNNRLEGNAPGTIEAVVSPSEA